MNDVNEYVKKVNVIINMFNLPKIHTAVIKHMYNYCTPEEWSVEKLPKHMFPSNPKKDKIGRRSRFLYDDRIWDMKIPQPWKFAYYWYITPHTDIKLCWKAFLHQIPPRLLTPNSPAERHLKYILSLPEKKHILLRLLRHSITDHRINKQAITVAPSLNTLKTKLLIKAAEIIHNFVEDIGLSGAPELYDVFSQYVEVLKQKDIDLITWLKHTPMHELVEDFSLPMAIQDKNVVEIGSFKVPLHMFKPVEINQDDIEFLNSIPKNLHKPIAEIFDSVIRSNNNTSITRIYIYMSPEDQRRVTSIFQNSTSTIAQLLLYYIMIDNYYDGLSYAFLNGISPKDLGQTPFLPIPTALKKCNRRAQLLWRLYIKRAFAYTALYLNDDELEDYVMQVEMINDRGFAFLEKLLKLKLQQINDKNTVYELLKKQYKEYIKHKEDESIEEDTT